MTSIRATGGLNRNLTARGILAIALLAVAAPLGRSQAAPAAASAKPVHFVRTDTLDFARILPAPPEPGSIAAEADLNVVLQVQQWRTPDEVAWARRIEKIRSLSEYTDIIGPWFTDENLPLTLALLKGIDADSKGATDASKKLFNRPRPFVVDPRVKPVVEPLDEPSYPSGHTTRFFLEAGVLSEIFPDKRGALLERAQKMSWGRVQGGVHFPTDLVGGRLLAAAIVAELDQDPAFEAALEKVRAEDGAFEAPAK
jgi:acid phosphatase (class A)